MPAGTRQGRFLGYANPRVICQNPHFRAKCALESLLKSKKTAINNDVQPYTLSLLRLIPKSRSARERTDPKMMAAERSRRTSYRRPARDSEITGALHYCRPAEAPGKMVVAGKGDVSRGGASRKKKQKKKNTPRKQSATPQAESGNCCTGARLATMLSSSSSGSSLLFSPWKRSRHL